MFRSVRKVRQNKPSRDDCVTAEHLENDRNGSAAEAETEPRRRRTSRLREVEGWTNAPAGKCREMRRRTRRGRTSCRGLVREGLGEGTSAPAGKCAGAHAVGPRFTGELQGAGGVLLSCFQASRDVINTESIT